MAKQNLIDVIQEQMQTDEEDRDKQAQKLKKRYNLSTPEEKEAIDDVMMCVCGWTMKTLIKGL